MLGKECSREWKEEWECALLLLMRNGVEEWMECEEKKKNKKSSRNPLFIGVPGLRNGMPG